jgi:hypothetical protein
MTKERSPYPLRLPGELTVTGTDPNPRTWEQVYDFMSDHWIELHEYDDATLEVIRQALMFREDAP